MYSIYFLDSTPKLKIDTEPSSTKVTRKRAKPSVSFNSNSSQNNLILNKEISPVGMVLFNIFIRLIQET
jgi:hypothetical protein